jgi:hypothetical protein
MSLFLPAIIPAIILFIVLATLKAVLVKGEQDHKKKTAAEKLRNMET